MNKLKKEIAELKERVYWLEDAYSKTLIEEKEVRECYEPFDQFCKDAEELSEKLRNTLSKDEKELYAYQQGRFDERRDMKAKLIDLIEEL
jgi:hypothetical protein